ncbi:MAG: hypothetical protein IPM95_08050 [Sphingobacteriales bacterium]|nr:hypothetical protein [Sphingobacteriales bacterium]
MLLASQILVFLPIVMMFLVALGFVGLVMGVTHWMGPHHKSKTKLEGVFLYHQERGTEMGIEIK